MSSDVDLFAEASAGFDFVHAVDVVMSAYQHEGIQVDIEICTASFARLNVVSDGESAKVELTGERVYLKAMYSRRTALFTLLGVVTRREAPRGRCRVR